MSQSLANLFVPRSIREVGAKELSIIYGISVIIGDTFELIFHC
jgi:hypothetical protein